MQNDSFQFWSLNINDLIHKLGTSDDGLNDKQVEAYFNSSDTNLLKHQKKSNSLFILLNQFKSPITIILIFACVLSFMLHDRTDAIIIFIIILISGFLGFWQENSAANAFEKLLASVQITSTVMRNKKQVELPLEYIIPGDIVILSAGDIVPADCIIINSKDLFVNEATLTGETFPVEKEANVLDADTPLNKRTNSVWMGTNIVSGNATVLVIKTGKATEFGQVSEKLKKTHEETEFEKGIAKFGYFLMEVTFLLVIAIFAINIYLSRPILDSFLFSLALAVGLTPQLLPVIISINLSYGAKKMAKMAVIVKRLSSIENLGSMNLLCSDKTGTLTTGILALHSISGINNDHSEKAALFTYLNAYYQTGFKNPIDQAIIADKKINVSDYKKYDEVPYDFVRKLLTVAVVNNNQHYMITKGALKNVMEVCSSAEISDGSIVAIETVKDKINDKFKDFSKKGIRTLGIAYKNLESSSSINKENENNMIFLGLIFLMDPLKPNISHTIKDMEKLGVQLKMITGDNKDVACAIGEQLGFHNQQIITGTEIGNMSNEALIHHVNKVKIFAEVEPNQKERIIHELKKSGNIVGYIGDGINDASALHTADVGISVDTAVDVAKEAADIVLLKNDLSVLIQGIKEGRKTFANTLKYIFIATSANFGNMFSMAGASLFLSFLPLLPKQILLINLLTDFPQTTISTDNVDEELVDQPRRWDIGFIRKFMVTFGLVSSIFDFLTFGVLLLLIPGMINQFRTGWFMESIISAVLMVLVIRTRKSIFKSVTSKYLIGATFLITFIAFIFPFTPLGSLFGFEPLKLPVIIAIIFIIFLYVLTAEFVKNRFYKKLNGRY